MKIKCIINGTETSLEVDPTDSIKKVGKKVLRQTKNDLRPDKKWHEWQYISHDPARTLNINKTIGEEISDGGLFFMTLKAGTGA